ncbi:hypothetical protein PENTCL1PPCAC_4144, partial [Pristionchus entomophagus]
RFTRDELARNADGDMIYIRIRVIVARSYFTLSKLLKEPTTVPEKNVDLVKRILRGEKTAGADWSITVASDGTGDRALPLTYHVHTQTWRRVGSKWTKLDVVMKVMFAQWERAICDQALALDKRDPSSYVALARLLMIIWCSPNLGVLPVAKRVAIGTFADMTWMDSEPGVDGDLEWPEREKVIRMIYEAGLLADQMKEVFSSVVKHRAAVSSVRKIGLGAKNKPPVPE